MCSLLLLHVQHNMVNPATNTQEARIACRFCNVECLDTMCHHAHCVSLILMLHVYSSFHLCICKEMRLHFLCTAELHTVCQVRWLLDWWWRCCAVCMIGRQDVWCCWSLNCLCVAVPLLWQVASQVTTSASWCTYNERIRNEMSGHASIVDRSAHTMFGLDEWIDVCYIKTVDVTWKRLASTEVESVRWLLAHSGYPLQGPSCHLNQ